MKKWSLTTFLLFFVFYTDAQEIEYSIQVKNINTYQDAKLNAAPLKKIFPNKEDITSKIIFFPELHQFKIVSNRNISLEEVKAIFLEYNLELITFNKAE